MTRNRELKLCALIDKQICINRTTLRRIKEIFALKSSCNTLKYTIRYCNNTYDTYSAFVQALRTVDPRYMLTLSLPISNGWNNFIYYVGLLKTIDYGNRIEDSYLRSLFLVRKKALSTPRVRESQISLRRLFEEKGIAFDRL